MYHSEGTVKFYDLSQKRSAPVLTCSSTREEVFLACCLAPRPPGLVLFAGGSGESIIAWSLQRTDTATSGWQGKPLWEMATGNRVVENLLWHTESASLLANTSDSRENKLGGHAFADYREITAKEGRKCVKHGQAKAPEIWPVRAAHEPTDFRACWAAWNGAFLLYRFETAPDKSNLSNGPLASRATCDRAF
eukprot:g73121.t1